MSDASSKIRTSAAAALILRGRYRSHNSVSSWPPSSATTLLTSWASREPRPSPCCSRIICVSDVGCRVAKRYQIIRISTPAAATHSPSQCAEHSQLLSISLISTLRHDAANIFGHHVSRRPLAVQADGEAPVYTSKSTSICENCTFPQISICTRTV